MKRTCSTAIAAGALLITLAGAGCAASGGPASARQPAAGPANAVAATRPAYVGYKWLVTSITKDGKQTPIPASEPAANQVYLLFTPNGQFGANDPINFHQATYRLAGDGFTTNDVIVGAVGYTGGDGPTQLAINAISAFSDGVHAKAAVTGDRLVVTVGGFVLNCRRDGSSGRSIF